MLHSFRKLLPPAVGIALALPPAMAMAQDIEIDRSPQVNVVGGMKSDAPQAEPPSEVERYCLNIADAARDARYMRQTKELEALEAEIEAKIEALAAERRAYQEWLEQRQAFMNGASPIVTEIYEEMRPDAAAAQLANIDRAAAASVIVKLKSRVASDILSEMPVEVAAELAGLIVEKTQGMPAPAAEAEQSS